MADIRVKQAHQLSENNAKAAAQKIADRMAAEYDMTSSWEGNVLRFRRSGLSGMLVLNEKEAQLEITLGFFLKAFSATLEQKITQQMQKVFCGAA